MTSNPQEPTNKSITKLKEYRHFIFLKPPVSPQLTAISKAFHRLTNAFCPGKSLVACVIFLLLGAKIE